MFPYVHLNLSDTVGHKGLPSSSLSFESKAVVSISLAVARTGIVDGKSNFIPLRCISQPCILVSLAVRKNNLCGSVHISFPSYDLDVFNSIQLEDIDSTARQYQRHI